MMYDEALRWLKERTEAPLSETSHLWGDWIHEANWTKCAPCQGHYEPEMPQLFDDLRTSPEQWVQFKAVRPDQKRTYYLGVKAGSTPIVLSSEGIDCTGEKNCLNCRTDMVFGGL